MQSLYQLTTDFSNLMECDDDISSALADIVAGQIEQKAENVCKFLTVLETTAEQFKAEEKRISTARKALENKAERVREYIKESMLNADIEKLSAGTFKLSVSLSGGSVVIDDPESIPPRFVTVIPEQYQPDKAAIKAAIKAGEDVTGAHIEAGYTLRIR